MLLVSPGIIIVSGKERGMFQITFEHKQAGAWVYSYKFDKYCHFPDDTQDKWPDPRLIQKWCEGEGYIQDVMPNLSADCREFLLSGITPDEWDSMFNIDEECREKEERDNPLNAEIYDLEKDMPF